MTFIAHCSNAISIRISTQSTEIDCTPKWSVIHAKIAYAMNDDLLLLLVFIYRFGCLFDDKKKSNN